MSPRDWHLFVDDMLEAITKISRYTAGADFEGFSQDERTIDAVVRNLEIIDWTVEMKPISIAPRLT